MKQLRLLLASLFMIAVVATAMAVPANSRPQKYLQPDGSQVTLRLVGDEFYHFYLTDDNVMVLADDGAYYFAEIGTTGRPVPSTVLAADASYRTAAQASFVSRTDTEALLVSAAECGLEARERCAVSTAATHRAPARAGSWTGSGVGTIPNTTFPVTGSPRMCVILVEFSDLPFTLPNPATYFNNFASQPGFNDKGCYPEDKVLVDSTGVEISKLVPTGSARDFFTDASNGVFTPQFDVYGPVKLPQPMAFYGGPDENTRDIHPTLMVRDALLGLDGSVDFSKYDADGDGVIDMVYIIFAGLGEANGGAPETIWPHAWYVYSSKAKDENGKIVEEYFDGKLLDHYACSAELFMKDEDSYVADGIGTFCHEFSHVLGLSDEYDTSYGLAYLNKLTPGEYSLMDGGPYNDASRTPPTFSIFQRNALGWADIEVLKHGKKHNVEMGHTFVTNMGYAIETSQPNEFYLIENRQPTKWDSKLPGHGMLLWHIDYDANAWQNNRPNNVSNLQRIGLVWANYKRDASTGKYIFSGRPFPGTGSVTKYNPKTNAGIDLEMPFSNITEDPVTGKISFTTGIDLDDIETVPVSALVDGVATIDFSKAAWGFPADYTTVVARYDSAPYSIVCRPGSIGNGWKKQGSALIIGQIGSSITLPPFGFEVEKIVCRGVKNSSTKVTYNIYVGETAVSTEVTGCSEDQTFEIDEQYQAAGNVYSIKLGNRYNAQFQIIEVYGRIPEPSHDGEYDVYTFTFTGDDAYGMTLGQNNADGYACSGENVGMTLKGNTRWTETNSNRALSFYPGSTFDIVAAEGYKVHGVKIGGAENWEPAVLNDVFVDSATFINSLATDSTSVSNVDVKLIALPSFTLDNLNVSAVPDGVSLLCKLNHANSRHVQKYKVWVVEYAEGDNAGEPTGAATEIGSIEISADDLVADEMALTLPLSLGVDTGNHTVAVRAHAEMVGGHKVYFSGWKDGDEEGATGFESFVVNTNSSGIGVLTVDKTPVYYDLQGNRIAKPLRGSIVIRVINGHADLILAQ